MFVGEEDPLWTAVRKYETKVEKLFAESDMLESRKQHILKQWNSTVNQLLLNGSMKTQL